jgi:hypothetical protein
MSMGKGKQLKKSLRQSRRAFPFQLGLGAITSLATWGLRRLLGFPSWLAVAVIVFACFGAFIDGLNIIYCRLGLRRLEKLEQPDLGGT